MTVAMLQMENSFPHELGHVLALGHNRDDGKGFPEEGCHSDRGYGCGYTWPSKYSVTDPATICPTNEPFRTMMSKREVQVIGGTPFQTNRLLLFSDPFILREFEDCFGAPGDLRSVPTGTFIPSADAQSANAARRVREVSDDIAAYRADWGFFRDRRTDLYAKSIV